MAAVDGTGTALAPDEVVAAGGFDFIAAQIAADGILYDLHGKAPLLTAGCVSIKILYQIKPEKACTV